MKIKKIERGIHTIELYACNLKYEQVQKVNDWLAKEKSCRSSGVILSILTATPKATF